MKLGIEKDFSLGYASLPGFRASICHPFKFYDLENDQIVTHKKIVDIQTPQVYKYKELFECYSFLSKNNITGMVDTTESMFNFNKYKTQVIRGEENNLKITYKSDLDIIEKAII